MAKKTQAERNAIRKQGWNEVKASARQFLDNRATKVKDKDGNTTTIQSGEQNRKQMDAVVGAVKGVGKMIFNDLSWYSNYPDLSKGIITPNTFLNQAFVSEEIMFDDATSAQFGVPTVAAMSITLTPGAIAMNQASPVVTAIDRIYQSVRRANSGSTNGIVYQDYYKYITNIRAAIALYSVGLWAFGSLNKFSSLNTLAPKDLFRAKGLDYQTFFDNAANFSMTLSQIYHRLKPYFSLNLDLFERTMWLFKNTYRDSNTFKNQKYLMRLHKYMYYTADASVTSPTWVELTSGLTYTDWLAKVNEVLTAFTNDSKYSIITGDILKALGGSSQLDLPKSNIDYITPEVYVEEVLQQIQNATVLSFDTTFSISENLVISAETDARELGLILNNKPILKPYVNVYKNRPSNEEIISYTRFTVTFDWSADYEAGGLPITSMGTEFIDQVSIVYPSKLPNANVTVKSRKIDTTNIISSSDTALSSALVAAFDWFPRTNFMIKTSDADFISWVVYDYNNYALLDDNLGQTYHTIAYLSMSYVPLLYRSIRTEKVAD